jgi:RHS repeat-associated protein
MTHKKVAQSSSSIIRSMAVALKAVVSVALCVTASLSYAAQAVTYYHWDALGSPVAATDESGNVIWREQYRPYGERLQNDPGAAKNTRWYTGHPHDSATGLTYAGARYYDPVVGRFMGVDRIAFNEDDPLSFNRFSYGNNSPYKYVDPDGNLPVLIVPILVGTGLFTLTEFAHAPAPREPIPELSALERVEMVSDAFTRRSALSGPIRSVAKHEASRSPVQGVAESTGEAVGERAKNIAKGISPKDLGPSGKRKLHVTRHSTLKGAKDATTHEGKGAPMKHSHPKVGRQHYHATDEAGEKIPGLAHHEFPDRFK